MKQRPRKHKGVSLIDFERLCYEVRPGDVLLISSRSRVGEVIKLVTQSRWTHSALYIGKLHEIDDPELREKISQNFNGDPNEPLIVESEMGKGTVVSPLMLYNDYHIRICRPRGLSRPDSKKVITYAINHIGHTYDFRQIFDLARFLFPWSILPRRWRSSLFRHNPGTPTKESCSLLIAEAFRSVKFPILPHVRKDPSGKISFIHRHPRLYVPSDFDYSPYFDIIKYPVFEAEHVPSYRTFPWQEDTFSDHVGNIYQAGSTKPVREKKDKATKTENPK